MHLARVVVREVGRLKQLAAERRRELVECRGDCHGTSSEKRDARTETEARAYFCPPRRARHAASVRRRPTGICRHAHLRRRERPLIGELGDPLVGRPVAVRALRLDADEHRLVAALRRLHRRRELERVARHHAVVVIGRRDERRRIAGARLDVLQRRVLDQERELRRVRRRAVLGDPGAAAGELVVAQHVHHADRGQRHREEIRPLLHHRADQQPAVRAAHDAELRRRGVLLLDQVLGRPR